MRIFTAIAFDSRVKDQLSELCESLRRAGVTGSFTPAENLHLTLKFLGEVSSENISKIKAALKSAALTVNPFSLSSKECGYFSNRGEKTVWLGMTGSGLSDLANTVDLAFSQLGFETEKRSFTPHITLVRKAHCDATLLSEVNIPHIEQTVSCATLFESRRDAGRLWYKPLFTTELGTTKP